VWLIPSQTISKVTISDHSAHLSAGQSVNRLQQILFRLKAHNVPPYKQTSLAKPVSYRFALRTTVKERERMGQNGNAVKAPNTREMQENRAILHVERITSFALHAVG
jgi:hypothetical protein